MEDLPAPLLTAAGAFLRTLFLLLGPVYVKAGQLLSVRHDLLPEQVTQQLEQLQDRVPTVSWRRVERVVAASFGKKLQQIEELDPSPVASGSLCQVYRVTLGGKRAGALKVIRPGARQAVERAFGRLARLLEKLPALGGPVDLKRLLQAVQTGLLAHLDLRREACHAQRFRRNFQHNDLIRFPAPFPGLISREALVMEYFDGVKLSRYAEIGADPVHLASLGLSSIYQMVFQDGWVHGDLHPANIFVLDGGKRVGYIDLGLVCRIPKRERRHLGRLLSGLAHQKSEVVATAAYRLAGGRKNRPPRALAKQVAMTLEKVYDKPVEELPIGAFLRETLLLLQRHHLSFPEHLSLALASLLSIEGASKKLFPAANPFAHAREFLLWERA